MSNNFKKSNRLPFTPIFLIPQVRKHTTMKFLFSAVFFAPLGAIAFAPVIQIHVPTSLNSVESDLEAPASADVETGASVESELEALETPPELKASVVDTPSQAKLDLEALATELNPLINYYDPLNLIDTDFYNQGQEASIAILRQAEIKHSRVAMAAFLGYCVQSNYHWPLAMSLDGSPFPSVDLSPEAQWDAIPAGAKYQILFFVGALEFWDEASGGNGKHYLKGGKVGEFASLNLFNDNIHYDMFDPLGFNKNASQETKNRRLAAEINNGRLAMLAIIAFMTADKIEGSVPFLEGIAIPYDGNVMSPFEAGY